MEHLGVATVEAMAAGCVPLAPAFGGQVEIVGELVQHSPVLIRDEPLWARTIRAAAERSLAFEPSMFDERIRQLMEEIVPRRISS